MDAWYALYTKPGAEGKVANTLTERGMRVCLPMLPQRDRGRANPLFPTYLFVRCDLDVMGLSVLEWTPGLRRILSFGGRPARVPDSAVELIERKLVEIEASGGLPAHGFSPGDEVMIDSGPLAGLYGIFQGPVGPAERVHILLRFLGEANRTEIPVASLRSISPDESLRLRRRGTRGHGRPIHVDRQ